MKALYTTLLIIMTAIAGALYINAHGLIIGGLCTLFLLGCGYCASFTFGD